MRHANYSSRVFIASVLASLIIALPTGFTAPVEAAAPMAKRMPGFHRFMLGDFEVTALSDGTVALPVDKLLTNTTPDKVKAQLAKYYYLTAPTEGSVIGFLVNTGPKLILIDTGAG